MKNNTILLVDDEQDTLKAVSIGLEERGYKVLTADSGEEALKILKTTTPDLIIIDLRMQPMNGFELYTEIKKNKNIKSIPTFFLTAVDEPLAQKYSETLGIDAYITKPVDIDKLETIIKNQLTK